jgi:hypothetical protein
MRYNQDWTGGQKVEFQKIESQDRKYFFFKFHNIKTSNVVHKVESSYKIYEIKNAPVGVLRGFL